MKELTKLMEYAELEGSELGETFRALDTLYSYRPYIGDKLLKALEAEIKQQYKYMTEHCKIVKRPETTTRIVEELEWDE